MSKRDLDSYPGEHRHRMAQTTVPMVADMTLRDWFAGQALVGLVSRGSVLVDQQSYAIADAMLIERDK